MPRLPFLLALAVLLAVASLRCQAGTSHAADAEEMVFDGSQKGLNKLLAWSIGMHALLLPHHTACTCADF